MLEDLKSKYAKTNSVLYDFLKHFLLQSNPELRSDPSELFEMVKDRSRNILFLQEFDTFKKDFNNMI